MEKNIADSVDEALADPPSGFLHRIPWGFPYNVNPGLKINHGLLIRGVLLQ